MNKIIFTILIALSVSLSAGGDIKMGYPPSSLTSGEPAETNAFIGGSMVNYICPGDDVTHFGVIGMYEYDMLLATAESNWLQLGLNVSTNVYGVGVFGGVKYSLDIEEPGLSIGGFIDNGDFRYMLYVTKYESASLISLSISVSIY